jgi:hypothetical protein
LLLLHLINLQLLYVYRQVLLMKPSSHVYAMTKIPNPVLKRLYMRCLICGSSSSSSQSMVRQQQQQQQQVHNQARQQQAAGAAS